MRSVQGAAIAALILGLFVACTGEADSVTAAGADGGYAAGGDGAPPGCSASGAQASCDPLVGSGCGAGSCYLVKNLGPACVCTDGVVTEGGACNTTVECGPGLVCAGTTAPGTCRTICDPASPSCTGKTYCRFIAAFPSYGYCEAQ